MSRKLMVVLAICLFAAAAFAQLPATGTAQAPTYPAGTTSGVDKWGATPGATATTLNTGAGYAFTAGQQFNSKWNMVGGHHDLTTNASNINGAVTWSSGNVAASRLCSFCHTAHDNESEFADRSQLWAHAVPSSFTAYSSATLQSTPNTTATSQTAQCLGCHDGTVGLSSGNYGTPDPATADMLVAGTAITTAGKLSSPALLVPLSRTHPVSFTYDAALAAKHQLRVPASTSSIDGYGIIPLFGSTGTMECATCHDPHIKSGILRRAFPTGASQDAGTGSFCMYCHL